MKEVIIPHTVPKSPMKGAVVPVVARKVKEPSSLDTSEDIVLLRALS